MSNRAEWTATVQSWDEKAYDVVEGTPKTVKASISYAYEGAVTGTSGAEMVMVYVGEEAVYVGLERVTATVDGKSGTFVTSVVGGFKDGVASSSWDVVPGSGTDELAGISGKGSFEAPSGSTATVKLDYELAG